LTKCREWRNSERRRVEAESQDGPPDRARHFRLAADDGTLCTEDDGKRESTKSVASYLARAFGDEPAEDRDAMEARNRGQKGFGRFLGNFKR
jgi:hypothetical protein